MNETDDGVKVYIGADNMHYMLETPRAEYEILYNPLLEKVSTVFWLVDVVVENGARFGGDYEAFTSNNVDRVGFMRNHWPFLKKHVRLLIPS